MKWNRNKYGGDKKNFASLFILILTLGFISIVNHGQSWTIMVNHGQPWLMMINHVL